nr:hypothetical protein [Tanacetum cinerariifolium]
MTLSGLEGVKHFKLRKLKHSNPKRLNQQMLPNLRLLLKGTDPHVRLEKNKSTSEGLETVLTKPATGKGAIYIKNEIEFAEEEFNTSPDLSSLNDTKKEIKLEDLSKLVLNLEVDFIDLDSPEVELSKLLSSYDFSSSLPTKLKELPSKFKDLTKEIKELKKHVYELEIKLPGDLKDIPTKLEKFSSAVSNLTTQVAELKTLQWEIPAEFLSVPSQVSNVKSKIKTLDAFRILLNKITEALDMFAQAVQDASQKASDQCVPSAGQAGTHLTEGEKNTRQVTITQLFKQRTEKDVEKANLNKQPIPTTTQTTAIPPTIPTTLQLQSPFLSSLSKSCPQHEGEIIKKDKGKKAMSSKDAKEEGTKSDSDDANLTGSKVESFTKKKLKKFDFVTKKGDFGLVVEPFILSLDLNIKLPKYKQAKDNSAYIRRRHFSFSSL